MNWLKQLWRNLTTSTELALMRAENRRLRDTNIALEEELEQSRKETRAAVNNLLSTAGVAPLPPAEEIEPPKNRMRRLSLQQQQREYAATTEKRRLAAIADFQKQQKEGTNG